MNNTEYIDLKDKIKKYEELQSDINDIEENISLMEDRFNDSIYSIYSEGIWVYFDEEVGNIIYNKTMKVLEDKLKFLKEEQDKL